MALPAHFEDVNTTSRPPTIFEVLGRSSSSLSTDSQLSMRMNHSLLGHTTSSKPLVSHRHDEQAPSTRAELDRFIGYLAKRRSASSSDLPMSAAQPTKIHEQAREQPRPRLKKSSSCVRLSLSNEGNAQITTKDTSSPSPPRVPPLPPTSTESNEPQQQQTTPTSVYPTNAPLFKPLQRSSSGRSRDSRAWEFWCDKDARGELEDKAEKDASGSAAGAIDLLRSASGRRILGTLPNKRNSGMLRHMASKRPKLDGKPVALKRSSTSLGRLQSRPANTGSSTLSHPAKLKHHESATSIRIPGSDSDKENWSPVTSENTDDSLSTSRVSDDQRSTLPEMPPPGRGRLLERPSGKENDPEADGELAAFMRPNKSKSISQEEELCVQNLLSLSQGNWR